MSQFHCEVCGAEATVHVTQIEEGKKRDVHFCAAHAQEAGMTSGAAQTVAGAVAIQGLLANLRGSIRAIKRSGRMPATVEELRAGMAMAEEGDEVEIKDAETAKRLAWMERMVGYVEAHGHPPTTPEEIREFGGEV